MKNKSKNTKTYEDLIAGYYGTPISKKKKTEKKPVGFVLSKSMDSGEILAQKKSGRRFTEYIVQSSLGVDTPFEEYIVAKEPACAQPVYKETNNGYPPAKSYNAKEETPLDTKAPLQQKETDKQTDPVKSNYTDTPVPAMSFSDDRPAVKKLWEEVKQTKSTDDDFVKDMQAILTGQKVFDPVHKKTVSKSEAASTSTAQSVPGNQLPPLPQLENKHAIFDQLRESMAYAQAYDLGDINLEKRFSEFDKAEDKKKSRTETRAKPSFVSSQQSSSTINNEDFIKDLDKIAAQSVSNISGSQSVQAYPSNDTGYSYSQNPAALVAAIETADAIQIGLGAASLVQAQVSASQGSFSLSYDKAQRMLTNEARTLMPGSQAAKQSYSKQLFFIGGIRLGTAEASVIIEWEGNAYGEIGTAIIRRDLKNSTEWSKSTANLTITKIDRIPTTGTDPRTWPLVYTYEGTYNPVANGYFEFSGEFEINAFGGLKFNRHEVVSRSLIDFTIMGKPEDYVQKGATVIVATPAIPQEQIDYLRSKLP